MRTLITIFVALVGLATTNAAKTLQVAVYDEPDLFNPTPAPLINKVPSPYRGLNYSGLVYAAPGPLPPGVVPHSLPIYIGTAPAVEGVTGPGVISIKGTSSKSFDLLELFYGCIIITEVTLVQQSIACRISVTGYKNFGKTKVGPATLAFSPNSLLRADMQRFTFGTTFSDLEEVRFELAEVTGLAKVYLLDSLKYYVNT